MHPNSKKGVIFPNENDVLCGRGASTYEHSGNKKFRSIVAKNKLAYNRSEIGAKPIIAKAIVTYIETRYPSGRYLTRDKESDVWYEISNAAAVQKTQQALREKTKWVKNDSQFTVLKSNQIHTKKQVSSSSTNKPVCPKLINDNGNDILDKAVSSDIFPLTSSTKTSIVDNDFELRKLSITSGDLLIYTNSSFSNVTPNKDDIDKLIVDTFYDSSNQIESDVVVTNKPQQQIKDESRVRGNTRTKKGKRLLDSNKIKSMHESFAKGEKLYSDYR